MKGSKYYGPEPIKLKTFDTIDAINGAISEVKEYDFGNGPKLVVTLDDIWTLALNSTCYRVIAGRYGDETDRWFDKKITVYKGRLRFRGEEQDGLCVRVPPPEDGEAPPIEERPPLPKKNDLDDDIPF